MEDYVTTGPNMTPKDRARGTKRSWGGRTETDKGRNVPFVKDPDSGQDTQREETQNEAH